MVYWAYNTRGETMITYTSLVWWTKITQKTAMAELSKVQRLACLRITGGSTAGTSQIISKMGRTRQGLVMQQIG